MRVAAVNDSGTGAYAGPKSTKPKGPPNWRISSIRISNPPAKAGDHFSLGVTASNAGAAEAPATTLRWYRSDVATITPDDDHQILSRSVAKTDAGVTRVMNSGPVGAESGTYYYGACLDPADGEEDHTNNCSEAERVTV